MSCSESQIIHTPRRANGALSYFQLGDEGLSSKGTKLNLTFITAEVTFTKPKQPTKDSGFELTGYSDADYARCKDTFKSTSSGAQFLGENMVSWSSKKQDCTALSTAEAEYVSLSA
ncbi:uncharacterized mitochondrial protein-like protein, partial [Tanacetum coccineum]